MALFGVDDFFWTAYFCEDAYFRTSNPILEHLQDMGDGPSGGARMSKFPLWDPRYYFLSVLVIRVDQIVMEWEVIADRISIYLEKDVCIFCRGFPECSKHEVLTSVSHAG